MLDVIPAALKTSTWPFAEMPSGTQLTAEQQAELEDLEVENALLRGLAEDVLLAKVRLQQRKARAIHTSVVNYTGGHVPPGTDTTWA